MLWKEFPCVCVWVLRYKSHRWGCSLLLRSHQCSNRLCNLVFCLFSFQWQLVLDGTCMILCYIRVQDVHGWRVHQSLPHLDQLPQVTGLGGAAWTLGLQCHVQKLDSWTGTLVAEQICAHLSNVLWCDQMSLVHSEVQWMKYNPRKPEWWSQSHHWPAICERASSLTSSLHVPPPCL